MYYEYKETNEGLKVSINPYADYNFPFKALVKVVECQKCPKGITYAMTEDLRYFTLCSGSIAREIDESKYQTMPLMGSDGWRKLV